LVIAFIAQIAVKTFFLASSAAADLADFELVFRPLPRRGGYDFYDTTVPHFTSSHTSLGLGVSANTSHTSRCGIGVHESCVVEHVRVATTDGLDDATVFAQTIICCFHIVRSISVRRFPPPTHPHLQYVCVYSTISRISIGTLLLELPQLERIISRALIQLVPLSWCTHVYSFRLSRFLRSLCFSGCLFLSLSVSLPVILPPLSLSLSLLLFVFLALGLFRALSLSFSLSLPVSLYLFLSNLAFVRS